MSYIKFNVMLLTIAPAGIADTAILLYTPQDYRQVSTSRCFLKKK